MKRLLLLLLFPIFGAGCAGTKPMPTVDYVDIDRFMGDWYVIANIPTFLEEGAHNAVESYRLAEDGTIDTTFTFNKGAPNGPLKVYTPRGFLIDKSSNAVWGMQFIWPFKAEYRTNTYRRTQLEDWREQYLATKIEPIVLPKARDLLERHRARGDELIIITATNRFITEPIARRLGVVHLIATEAEMVAGEYTGNVAGTPCFQAGKVTRLLAWLQQHRQSLEHSWFYSDSHNDLPLLERVDHPVAVDPDDRLRAHAAQQDWPVISLRGDQPAPVQYHRRLLCGLQRDAVVARLAADGTDLGHGQHAQVAVGLDAAQVDLHAAGRVAELGEVLVELADPTAQGGILLDEYDLLATLGGLDGGLHVARVDGAGFRLAAGFAVLAGPEVALGEEVDQVAELQVEGYFDGA